jgi:hypothetical protein
MESKETSTAVADMKCADLVAELDVHLTRAAWLQNMHTLHRTVEMLYVVDGYQVTLCWDGTPISPDYHGETLALAIDKAMAEFDSEARPKWIGRRGDPALIEEQLAVARALLAARAIDLEDARLIATAMNVCTLLKDGA